MKCEKVDCNYLIHTDINNNGGTHCCIACKLSRAHGPLCQRVDTRLCLKPLALIGAKKTTAIIFLTIRPSVQLIQFAEKLQKDSYTVYLCIDDNKFNTSHISLKIIKYNENECISKGFRGLSLSTNRPIAWDKAMYHVCRKDTSYDYVYFIEDDVFITSHTVIDTIDKKHPNADLLCQAHNSETEHPAWPHWHTTNLPKPLYHSMVCACRLSRKLLELISIYAKKHNSLGGLEVLFNTIAAHNRLIIQNPKELRTIWYVNNWQPFKMTIGNMYHPIKNQALHPIYRNKLQIRLQNRLQNSAIKTDNQNAHEITQV
jgi:hypothetical protein